jgi:hypothetical protein
MGTLRKPDGVKWEDIAEEAIRELKELREGDRYWAEIGEALNRWTRAKQRGGVYTPEDLRLIAELDKLAARVLAKDRAN